MTTLLKPGNAGYDDARRIHNGMIDKHPAVIARCTSTADIVDAVRLGRESGGEVAVRGGGHNVAGKAVTEGGLMIDLAPRRADRKSTRLNSSHITISYAAFRSKKKTPALLS